jgi:uncharacterized protein
MLTVKQVLFMLFMLFSVSSFGASFNCTKAVSWVETAICTDKQVSDLDELLLSSYKKALSGTADVNSLKAAQRDWLKSVRDVCKDIACLKEAYTSRLNELNESVASAKKTTSISGKYQRFYKGKPDDTANINITELVDGRVHVDGNAIWVGDAETGNVNMGELDGNFQLDAGKIYYSSEETEGCRLTITFAKNALVVAGDNGRCGGLNVSFDGEYRKII